MSSEKFCLRWNDFESNISLAFRELRDDKDFFDVTLACDDEQISAHKVILSACSPFFRNILRRNPHQHPLLYLKGVKYTDLQSVLNFMYHGEVNVAQEELNSFLAVAEDLRVKGLTQNQGGAGSASRRPKSPVSKPNITRPPDRDIQPAIKRPRPVDQARNNINPHPPISNRVDDDDIQEVVPVKSEPRDPIPQSPMAPPPPSYHDPGPAVSTPQPSHSLAPVDDQTLAYQDESYEDYGQYDADQSYEGSMMETGMMAQAGADGNKESDIDEQVAALTKKCGPTAWVCTDCGKRASQRTDLKKHIEAAHLNLYLPCDVCGAPFKTRHHRQNHMRTAHGMTSKY